MLAVSTLGLVLLGGGAIVVLMLLAPLFTGEGRRTEQMSDLGDRISRDRPEFKRPPDEGGLL